MGQFGNYKGSEEWLEKLSKQQEKEFLAIIDLKVESELLQQFVIDNPLPFCLCSYESPFEAKTFTSGLLVNLINMINEGRLILSDEK